MKNGKKTILHAVICVGLVCLMWGGYVFVSKYARISSEKNHIRRTNTSQDQKILCDFDIARSKDKDIVISGWVLRIDSSIQNVSVVLRELQSHEEIVLDTVLEERGDEEEEISLHGGKYFKAEIKEKKINANDCYEVMVYGVYHDKKSAEKKEIKIKVNWFVYENELFMYNPLIVSSPQVNDSVFQTAIEQGTLVAYSTEENAWIYKYAGKLYYVLDATLLGSEEEKVEIPLYVYPVDSENQEMQYVPYFLTKEDYENQEDFLLLSLDCDFDFLIKEYVTGVYYNKGEHVGYRWKTVFRDTNYLR